MVLFAIAKSYLCQLFILTKNMSLFTPTGSRSYDQYSTEVKQVFVFCFVQWYEKERNIKLRVHSGGPKETLNFLYVSNCEMSHFVTLFMKQNKKRKQTLESAQYRL